MPILVASGRWSDAAVRLLIFGSGSWINNQQRAYVFSIDGHPVATVRRIKAKEFLARIEGFEWSITSDMGIARFQKISGGEALTHTPVKLFTTISSAKHEVESLLNSKPG